MARSSASARALTDHNEIRQWAEQRDAQPTSVKGTGGNDDVGMIRLDFPGYSGQGSLEPIGWDDWLSKFDESNLALLVQDERTDGQISNFNKLVSRDSTEESSSSTGRRSPGKRQSTAKKSSRGTEQKRKTVSASDGRGSRKTSARGKKKSATASRGRTANKTAVRSSAKRSSSSTTGRRSGRRAA
jgi:hypothetical protein